MKLSIIVVTRNRAEMLKNCLNSLVRQTKKPDEVLAVDNNSNDNTEKMVDIFKKKLRIKYIFEPRIGIPIARNTGIKNSKHDVIAFIDDDCVADKNWITRIFIAHKYYPKTLIIQGRTHNLLKNNIFSESMQYLLNNCRSTPFDTKNLSFKRILLDNLEYVFDENFKEGEDTELGIRLKQRGHKVLQLPSIIVHHNHRTDLKSFAIQQFTSGKYAYLLKQKYKNHLKYLPDDLRNIYLLGASLFLMPFIHTFRGISKAGFKSAIKFFPIIFIQKLMRYSGFFSMRIINIKKRSIYELKCK